ncbi:MAG: peptidylprolyl isomerase [Nitrospirota bacterium]
MKKVLNRFVMVVAVLLLPGLLVLSCTRKDEAAKHQEQKRTPEQMKQQEEIRKGMEESKKVVAARVNGVEIPVYELVREMNIVASQYLQAGQKKDAGFDERVRKEALDRLVLEELVVQEAARQGIVVKPETVDDVVKKFKQHLKTEAAFNEYLKETGSSEKELRKRIERGHMVELVTGKEIYQKISIDEKRLRAEYEKHKAELRMPERFTAEDILLKGITDEAAAKKKAGEIIAFLEKNNNDFSKIRNDGTIMISRGRVTVEKHPAIYNKMKGMKAGELSGLTRDADGFHIFKVVSKEPPRQLSFDEAKAMIEKRVRAEEGARKMKEWEKALRSKANIEILYTSMPQKGKDQK